jgi:hypothetical protein
MDRLRTVLRTFSAAAVLAVSSAAYAASPSLDQVLPRGAQRGTEVEVTFRGNRIADAQEVFIYQPGITVTEFKAESATVAKAKLKIAADAPYGEYQMRLRTATGISELRNFYVGVYPVVQEAAEVGIAARPRDPKNPPPPEKLPSTFAKPQKLTEKNVTVAGVIELEQVDYYAVDCKKGERLNVEVEGMRLGQILDTHVTIVNKDRFEIAANDDNALSRQDAFVTAVIPEDGTYIIQVRESSYQGSANGHYRMHVGSFPRPKAVYPAGGPAGETVKVKLIGDAAGEFEQTLKLPATAGNVMPLHAEQNGLLAPTPNPFRVSPFGNVLETADNDDAAKATVYSGELPIALNGVIEKEGDTDFFKFRAKKGQSLEIHCYARRLRTPLDPIITLYGEKGNQIAQNDDSGGPDSYLRFNVPADGEYTLNVKDHLKNGGPEYVYRIEITETKPALTLTIPNMGVNFTQDRQWVVVPKGGRFSTQIRATRSEFAGDLKLIARDLPPGVSMSAEQLPQGVDMWAVTFEAAADAPVGGKLVELTAEPLGENPAPVKGEFKQPVELAQSGNNAPYFISTADKLAVAVVEEVPFTVEVVQPKVPLVAAGSQDLKVKVTRKGDFKGPINIRSVWDPPGVGASSITIQPDQTEGVLAINAQANARPAKWKTGLLASADLTGQTYAASNPLYVDVAPPFVTAQIVRTSVLQGEKTQVTVKLDQKVAFDGKAKIQLLGLPNEATAEEKDITKDDAQVVFDVTTTAKTPAATHNGLLVRITVMKDGEPIVHNVGQGGILRVDAPKKSTDPAKPKPVAAK